MSALRLTDKMWLLADVRFGGLMERRKHETYESGPNKGKPKSLVTAVTARCVGWALMNHSDAGGSVEGTTLEEIASDSEVDERTVRRVMKILEEENLITVENVTRAAGVKKAESANRYTMNWELWKELKSGGRLLREPPAPAQDSGRNGGQCVRRTADSVSGERRTVCPANGGQNRPERRTISTRTADNIAIPTYYLFRIP